MNEITDLAERLGKAIHLSPQAQKLRTARTQMEAHPQVMQLLKDFRSQSDAIARKEQEKQPVEVADKHRLEDLHRQLVANDLFKALTAAQVDYVDLMRKVNETLRKQLADTER